VRIVQLLADRSSGQWYGTNTVSGRMVFTTCARTTMARRRLSTRTKSPSTIPSDPAKRGWISHCGCGYWSTSAPMRRVCARQILRHHPSRRQHNRVVCVWFFGGGPPVGRLKMRLAVGMAELPAFVQARRAGMIERRARPKHAHLTIDALPRDTGVVGHAAFRGDAQLFEDVVRRLVCELVADAEPLREVANDPPVLTRTLRWLDDLPVMDHASLDVGGGPFVR
jgi:hypothetical protein